MYRYLRPSIQIQGDLTCTDVCTRHRDAAYSRTFGYVLGHFRLFTFYWHELIGRHFSRERGLRTNVALFCVLKRPAINANHSFWRAHCWHFFLNEVYNCLWVYLRGRDAYLKRGYWDVWVFIYSLFSVLLFLTLVFFNPLCLGNILLWFNIQSLVVSLLVVLF